MQRKNLSGDKNGEGPFMVALSVFCLRSVVNHVKKYEELK